MRTIEALWHRQCVYQTGYNGRRVRKVVAREKGMYARQFVKGTLKHCLRMDRTIVYLLFPS